jgi:hypothetical protein
MDGDEESEEEEPKRQLTSLEAVEAYSGSHSESFEELLEWPYRRFLKAFSAWQRRKAVDDIDNRKNLHVQAFWSITEWKEQGDQNKAIESVEQYYETLKNIVWNDSPERRKEQREAKKMEEDNPFLRAGKRNLTKFIPPKMPGQETIEEITNE